MSAEVILARVGARPCDRPGMEGRVNGRRQVTQRVQLGLGSIPEL